MTLQFGRHAPVILWSKLPPPPPGIQLHSGTHKNARKCKKTSMSWFPSRFRFILIFRVLSVKTIFKSRLPCGSLCKSSNYASSYISASKPRNEAISWPLSQKTLGNGAKNELTLLERPLGLRRKSLSLNDGFVQYGFRKLEDIPLSRT